MVWIQNQNESFRLAAKCFERGNPRKYNSLQDQVNLLVKDLLMKEHTVMESACCASQRSSQQGNAQIGVMRFREWRKIQRIPLHQLKQNLLCTLKYHQYDDSADGDDNVDGDDFCHLFVFALRIRIPINLFLRAPLTTMVVMVMIPEKECRLHKVIHVEVPRCAWKALPG